MVKLKNRNINEIYFHGTNFRKFLAQKIAKINASHKLMVLQLLEQYVILNVVLKNKNK